MSGKTVKLMLKRAYIHVYETILRYQSPTTGLFPLEGTDECEIGDVRTTIYSALALWSLHLAYRRSTADDNGKGTMLGQAAVKAMRGILSCWMYQIDQLRSFLSDQVPEKSLHVIFDLKTGSILADREHSTYPHLQLDCVSLYLLTLVQMIASGLQIIYTSDEVDFIQNLVFYIERSYRIADFGQWGRGTKYHNGTPELNASSVGMVKAAMEAVNGFNLFGENGASWTVVYVDIDAHMRNRNVYEILIPRESNSKATDAALLSTLSWPCFSIHNTEVRESCLKTIVDTLKGEHGLKRFSRDGFGTKLEKPAQKYYQPHQIKDFDGIECEYPYLQFYLIIDSLFTGNTRYAEKLYNEISSSLRYTDTGVIVPRYYYVPRCNIEQERKTPYSTVRQPSDEGPESKKYFLIGQSVYIIMKLLLDNLVTVNEIDPIKRYLSASDRPIFNHRYMTFGPSVTDQRIQVTVISESVRLQQTLAVHGIMSQTASQVEPLQIWSPNTLKSVLSYMGRNNKLKLTGRPDRPVGLLGTSMFYRVCGQTVISYPLLFEVKDFYTSQDINSVIDQVLHDIEILSNNWKLTGKPTYLIMVSEAMVLSPNAADLIGLLSSLKTGITSNKVKVKLDRLQSLATSSAKEHLDFLSTHIVNKTSLDDVQFDKIEEKSMSESQLKLNLNLRRVNKINVQLQDMTGYTDSDLTHLYRTCNDSFLKCHVLKHLLTRYDLNYQIDGVNIQTSLQSMRKSASQGACQDWCVVRLCSALSRQVVDSLAPSITNMLVKGKIITVGVFGHQERIIDKPLSPALIGSMLYEVCYPVNPCSAVLQQEMILILGNLHMSQPKLFNGILKIRIGWILDAMQFALNTTQGETSIYSLAPSEIHELVLQVFTPDQHPVSRSVSWHRRIEGSLGRLPLSFFEKVWKILERTPSGIALKGYTIQRYPTITNLTLDELNFHILVEEMVSAVTDPAQRQLTVEVIMLLATILDRNPELKFSDYICVDKIVHEVISLYHKSLPSDISFDQAQSKFVQLESHGDDGTLNFILKAISSMFVNDCMKVETTHCKMM